MCRIALETLSRNTLEEANVRIVATGGSSPDFMTPQGRPRLLVLVTPLPRLPAEWYDHGVKVVTMRSERRIPGAKSIDYVPAAMALQHARSEGAIEALYVDRDGNALEGTTSNLFALIDETLVTPGRGILSGITRQAVLDISKPLLPVEVRDLSLAELLSADEAFITGTNKGLVPVVQIDDTPIGDGKPGPHTRLIMSALETHLLEAL